MRITTIARPQETANPLEDYLAVMPKQYQEGEFFRIEGSDFYCQPYTGKSSATGSVGVKVYYPEYFEGKLVGHRVVRIQPNGKISKKGKLVELDFPQNFPQEEPKKEVKEEIVKEEPKKVVKKEVKEEIVKEEPKKVVKKEVKKEVPSTQEETKVLFEPQGEIKVVRRKTKQYKLIWSLLRGATIEQLEEVTGWNTKTVRAALYCDVKVKGYGVKKVGEEYRLILPENRTELLLA